MGRASFRDDHLWNYYIWLVGSSDWLSVMYAELFVNKTYIKEITNDS